MGSRDLNKTVRTFNSNTRSKGGMNSGYEISGDEMSETLREKLMDLQMRMDVMKLQMRFPLSDIQREGERFYEEVRQRFGEQLSYERVISKKINLSKHNIFD
jgi:hypothetical protein